MPTILHTGWSTTLDELLARQCWANRPDGRRCPTPVDETDTLGLCPRCVRRLRGHR